MKNDKSSSDVLAGSACPSEVFGRSLEEHIRENSVTSFLDTSCDKNHAFEKTFCVLCHQFFHIFAKNVVSDMNSLQHKSKKRGPVAQAGCLLQEKYKSFSQSNAESFFLS